jgi:hypothetical protein
MVTSQYTYKCSGIINHTTTNDQIISPSILNKEKILQLIVSINGAKHHIYCSDIIHIFILDYYIDELGNNRSVSDAIERYKVKNRMNQFTREVNRKKLTPINYLLLGGKLMHFLQYHFVK